jgi:hypothetical protein
MKNTRSLGRQVYRGLVLGLSAVMLIEIMLILNLVLTTLAYHLPIN